MTTTDPTKVWKCLRCTVGLGAGECSNCKRAGVNPYTGNPYCQYHPTCCAESNGSGWRDPAYPYPPGTSRPATAYKPRRYGKTYTPGDLENWGASTGPIDVSKMDDGHLMNTMRWLQENKMPPCWPKMIHEAKKRGLNWVPEYRGVNP